MSEDAIYNMPVGRMNTDVGTQPGIHTLRDAIDDLEREVSELGALWLEQYLAGRDTLHTDRALNQVRADLNRVQRKLRALQRAVSRPPSPPDGESGTQGG